jgi:pantoate--beta-alanine ligase
LELAQELWAHGERNGDTIRMRLSEFIGKEPLADIDYISVADTKTLEELAIVKNSALVSMAVRFGKTRLIDNVILE